MKNWTIVWRIGGVLTALVLLICALAVYVCVRLSSLETEAGEIRATIIPALDYLATVQRVASENNAIVYKHIYSPNEADRKSLEAVMAKNSKENGAALESYGKLNLNPDARALFDQMSSNRGAQMKMRSSILADSRAAETPEASAKVNLRARAEFDPLVSAYIEDLKKLVEYERRDSARSSSNMLASARATKVGVGIASFLAVLLAIGFGSIVIRGINRVLRSTSDALTIGADQIVSAAGHVSGSSQSLANGASEQAASLEETGASIEELNSMTKRNTQGAAQAKGVAGEARRSADKSAESVTRLNSAMSELNDSSVGVAKIVKTIDEIAFQTNILALNAAVEAARAGESGAGFAVVADEVRNLAQRSAQAAKETAEKIEKALTKSEEGVRISKEVGASLSGIAEQVRKLDGLLTEISASSAEQSQGIEQVNIAIQKIDQVTQANAAAAEESASASEELNAQAIELNHLVGDLLVLAGGRRALDADGKLGPVKEGGARKSDEARTPRQLATA